MFPPSLYSHCFPFALSVDLLEGHLFRPFGGFLRVKCWWAAHVDVTPPWSSSLQPFVNFVCWFQKKRIEVPRIFKILKAAIKGILQAFGKGHVASTTPQYVLGPNTHHLLFTLT